MLTDKLGRPDRFCWRDVVASVTRLEPVRLQHIDRFKGEGPGDFSTQPGVSQGTHRCGMRRTGGGLHCPDMQGLPLTPRGCHHRRRGLYRVKWVTKRCGLLFSIAFFFCLLKYSVHSPVPFVFEDVEKHQDFPRTLYRPMHLFYVNRIIL